VALAEIGDKTQLLALVLVARYRRRVPIILGMFAATVANHALAAGFGASITALLGKDLMRWTVGVSFLAMAAWVLVPDKLDDGGANPLRSSALLATLTAFFLAEMGDKTQIATVALAARYVSTLAVVAGTTLGMMIANVPVILAGERLLRLVPLTAARTTAAVLFAALGTLALLSPAAG
jgi:putative Ca2+/H+ antiporter (TMEM165/GDT1 family)